MYDSHVHSGFSPDSKATMGNIAKNALNKSLISLCFTDHYDLDYDGRGIGNDLVFSIEDHQRAIDELNKEFEPDLTLLKGIELGLQPHLSEKYKLLLASHEFDYVIGSLHTADREDLYLGNFFDSRSQEEAYKDYFLDYLSAIENFDQFHVLGHLDVIKRYGPYEEILPLHHYRKEAEDVLRALIEMGKGLEVNTSGIGYGLGDFHPSRDLLTLYYELGGEIVTLGSDSHTEDGTGAYFKEALITLKDIGFTHFMHFEKGKAIAHSIGDFL